MADVVAVVDGRREQQEGVKPFTDSAFLCTYAAPRPVVVVALDASGASATTWYASAATNTSAPVVFNCRFYAGSEWGGVVQEWLEIQLCNVRQLLFWELGYREVHRERGDSNGYEAEDQFARLLPNVY